MKKLLIALLCMAIAGSVVGCGGEEAPQAAEPTYEYEIAMITAAEDRSIDDHGAVQATWEGLRGYAESAEKTFKYYEPEEDSDNGRLAIIDTAIDAGAKVIVCNGKPFEKVIYTAQTKYPKVTFILVDGAPKNGDNKTEIAENCTSVMFDELESGFLAGYSVVMEGYTRLGFLSEGKSAAMKRYGYGFLQGCNAAAIYRGRYPYIRYKNCGIGDSAAVKEAAARWYGLGTSVIFVCGEGGAEAVLPLAKESKRLVMTTEPMKKIPDELLAVVSKQYADAAAQALEAFYEGDFPGGKTRRIGTEGDGIGIDLSQSKFTWFKQEEYDNICKALETDQIKLVKPTEVESIAQLIQQQRLYRMYVTEE